MSDKKSVNPDIENTREAYRVLNDPAEVKKRASAHRLEILELSDKFLEFLQQPEMLKVEVTMVLEAMMFTVAKLWERDQSDYITLAGLSWQVAKYENEKMVRNLKNLIEMHEAAGLEDDDNLRLARKMVAALEKLV